MDCPVNAALAAESSGNWLKGNCNSGASGVATQRVKAREQFQYGKIAGFASTSSRAAGEMTGYLYCGDFTYCISRRTAI